MKDQPTSLGETVDRCPFGYYREARDRGEVSWEEQVGAWIAPTYASVKKVFTDEDTFARPRPIDVVPGEKYVRIIGGNRHPSGLVGQERLDHRKWWLGLFSKSAVEAYRTGLIADVVDSQIDRFAGAGRAELVEDYTSRVSIRVIAAILGLPWDDDEWMAKLRGCLDEIEHYKTLAYLKPDEAYARIDRTLEASYEADALLKPFMDAARDHDNGSIMARIWRDEALAAWTEDDRYGTVRTFFGAGSDTTRTAMANALYLLLTRPEVAAQVRGADQKTVANFVEEALRLYGTVHFRSRLVQEDTEIAGTPIAKGQKVVAIMASAGRDPAQYEEPDEVVLDRPNIRQHIAFSVGIGTCAGAAVARVELQEGVSRIINRLPDLHLDTDYPEPQLEGLLFRLMKPIHVTFTPVAARE